MKNKNKIKTVLKNIVQFLIVMALISIFLHLSVFAESLPLSDKAKEIYSGSNLPSPPEGMSSKEMIQTLIFEGLDYVKMIVVVIGILYLTIMGYTLVVSSDEEEAVTKARRGITYTIIAFALISMSKELGRIFEMDQHSLLETPQEILRRARLFDRQIEIIITFIKYILGGFATIMVVKSGVKLLTSGGSEEEATKHKKSILYSAGGLLIVYLGDIFINKVFYKVDKNVYSGITGVHPKVDAAAGVEQIVGITNLIVSVVGPLAILMLLVGAFLYATAGGEDEKMDKAKRLILTSGVGIIIIYGAFALVSTVVSGKLQEIGAIAN